MDLQKEIDSLKVKAGYDGKPQQWQFGFDLACRELAKVVPKGVVVVPKEPYAYLIKHKFWGKDAAPEIYLAADFLGDDGVEKEKLTLCIPLYKGEDEAQEQSNDS